MRNCIITGGLGNQMFEYAYVLALRERGIKVALDISYYEFFKMHNGYELERVFGIKEKVINKKGTHMYWLRLLNRIRPPFLYTFDEFSYNKNVLDNPKKYIYGYWQDENYFNTIKQTIVETFVFKEIDIINNALATEMQLCNSISLHVRRGDYKDFGMTIIDEKYYKNAIELINKRVKAPIYYIFSDEIDISRNLAEGLGIKYNIVTSNRGQDSYKDMFLMTHCKHNIVANSSFSWWGAWLNPNQNKIVVSPKVWDENKKYFAPQCKNWIKL